MSKKYKLVPIFDNDKTVEVQSATVIEGGVTILSKKLKEIGEKNNIDQTINHALIIMVNKSNGEPIHIDEVKGLEEIFRDKAIIVSGITDLSGYILEEIEEDE